MAHQGSFAPAENSSTVRSDSEEPGVREHLPPVSPVPRASYDNQAHGDRRQEQLTLPRSPHPVPSLLASPPSVSFAYQIPVDVVHENGASVDWHTSRCAAGTSSSTGTARSQVRYDVGIPSIDGGASVSYPSLEQEIHGQDNYYDVNAILAYSQLSTELQAAEDADAAAQAAAGVIIADDGEQDDNYDFDDLDGFDVVSIGAVTNSSGTDAGYESETGSVAGGGDAAAAAASAASASITQSIRDHLFENGRRYHRFREGAYHFPNDDMEQEREDMKHTMFKLLCCHRLHFAPIGSDPHEVLDMGTGTGGWAIESK